MRIEVIGKNGFSVTDAIRGHAEVKASKLPRYFDRTQSITVALGKADGGNDFAAEIIVDVEHHDDFVSSATGEDLYNTIDAAVHKSTRQLAEFKDRFKHHRAG